MFYLLSSPNGRTLNSCCTRSFPSCKKYTTIVKYNITLNAKLLKVKSQATMLLKLNKNTDKTDELTLSIKFII